MREVRVFGFVSFIRMDLFVMLVGFLVGVFLVREILGGFLKFIGMVKVGWFERIIGCLLEGGFFGWLLMVGGFFGWLLMVGGFFGWLLMEKRFWSWYGMVEFFG